MILYPVQRALNIDHEWISGVWSRLTILIVSHTKLCAMITCTDVHFTREFGLEEYISTTLACTV
jgi:hypothetical protein